MLPAVLTLAVLGIIFGIGLGIAQRQFAVHKDPKVEQVEELLPQAIAALFLSLSSNPKVIIALILGLLLGIGMFMDINAALIILAPVLGPLTAAIGMDPVHAGVMIVIALNISLMTPPVGACLFVLSSVTGERIERISMALIPFLAVEVGILVLIAYWSDLTLFIPRLLLGE